MSPEQRMSSGCALAATFGDDVVDPKKNFLFRFRAATRRFMAPFWFTGPWTFKTKSGARITFLACAVTIPLAAISLDQLTRGPRGREQGTTQTHDQRSSSTSGGEVDLSGR
jgi:hypothetical protein